MKSKKHGKNTSEVEVLNITLNGIWLFAQGKEYFLSYKDFPWFKNATIHEICNVNLLHSHHLRWKQLDVDLDIDSLEHLDQYPLKYRLLATKTIQAAA